jgi:hypothetical protein
MQNSLVPVDLLLVPEEVIIVGIPGSQLELHALFWESGDNPDKEMEIFRVHSGLTEYLPLGCTHAIEKYRKLVFFYGLRLYFRNAIRLNIGLS